MSKYAAAGVSLDTADEAKRRIAELVRTTRTPLARGTVGGFGGMVRVPEGYKKPVLVMSTDGVGSKVLVAAAAGIHDTVGEDLVNHSVNDILVHGATPLAFLDYIATGTLVPEIAAQIVSGVARGCRAHDMTLAGGETAQMPDLYQAGQYDLAGSIVGVVEEDKALHGDRVTAGDQLIGYASTGLHTNGYTLARKIVFESLKLGIDDRFPETEQSVGAVLLAVHRSYAVALRPVLGEVHALAHVTGGGIVGNLVRISSRLTWPPLFRVLMRAGQVSRDEMRRVFNLGVGMIAVVARQEVETTVRAAERAQVQAWLIGEVRAGSKPVVRFEER